MAEVVHDVGRPPTTVSAWAPAQPRHDSEERCPGNFWTTANGRVSPFNQLHCLACRIPPRPARPLRNRLEPSYFRIQLPRSFPHNGLVLVSFCRQARRRRQRIHLRTKDSAGLHINPGIYLSALPSSPQQLRDRRRRIPPHNVLPRSLRQRLLLQLLWRTLQPHLPLRRTEVVFGTLG